MKSNRLAVSLLVLLAAALAAAPAFAQPVELTFTAWGGEAHWRMYDQLAAAFNEKHPNIKISFLPDTGDYVGKMKTNIIAGTGPDVYFSQEMQTVGFINDGWFIPLDDYIAKDPEFRIEQIPPGLFDSFRWDGKIGAIPVVTFVSMLFWNKQLFDEAGLAAPIGITWEQLVDNARALTKRAPDGTVTQYGHRVFHDGPNFYLYYLWAFGGGILDESRRNSLLDQPGSLEAIEYIRDLIWQHEVVPKPGPEMGEFWLYRGNLGMVTHGSWEIGYFESQGFLDFGVTSIPGGINMAYPNAFGISVASKHPDEAWEFIKFASGPEGQRVLAAAGLGIPTNMDPSVSEAYFTGPTVEQRIAAVEAVVSARAPRVVPGMQGGIIDQIFAPLMNQVFRNERDARSALEEAHRLTTTYLENFYSGQLSTTTE